jgi:hypothetical protein
MPPRWPRKPDRADPAYRKLEDRLNVAVHLALFAAVNSSLWFFRLVQTAHWPWTLWLTCGWLVLLLAHGIYVFGIADYSENAPATSPKSS